MPESEFHLRMHLLLELTQTGTVAEYTALFWEHLHHVLPLNSTLSIKCFIPQYIKGLRTDIQAAVQSQLPSSITRASSLARIKEDEIVKDAARAVEELDGCVHHGVRGLAPKETLTGVSLELAAPVVRGADHGVVAIDTSSLAAPTLTTCSMECPSRDAAVNIFPELAASVVCDEAINIDTVSVMAPTAATCSMGLIHGDVNSPVAVQMLRPSPWPSFLSKHTITARDNIVQPPSSAATVSSRYVVPCSTLPPLHVKVNLGCGQMSRESAAGLALMLSQVISVLKAIVSFVRPNPTKESLHNFIDHARKSQLLDLRCECLIASGLEIKSGSINMVLAAREACKAIWYMAHAIDILSIGAQHFSLPVVSSWQQGHLKLDDVFQMLKKRCTHNQYVQLACTIFEAHSEFHATSEVFTSMLNWEAALLPTDLLFDKYTELMTVEWHFCLVQPVHVYCLLPLAESPASATEYSCYTIISSTWWVFLVTMQIMIGGTDKMMSSLNVDGLIAKAWLLAFPWVQLQPSNYREAKLGAQGKCKGRSPFLFEEFLEEVTVWQHGNVCCLLKKVNCATSAQATGLGFVELQSWTPHPCIQCTLPASAKHSWFNSWLVLLLFREICSLQALSDYHVTGTFVLNKLMGLAPADGTGYGAPLQVEALVIIVCCIPLPIQVLMDVNPLCAPFIDKRRVTSLETKGKELFIGVPQSIIHYHLPLRIGIRVFIITSLFDFLDSIQRSSEKFWTAPIYCSEQFQWVIAWALFNGFNGSSGHILLLRVTNISKAFYNPCAAPKSSVLGQGSGIFQSSCAPLICARWSSLLGDSGSILATQNVEQRVLPKVTSSATRLWDPKIFDVHCFGTIKLFSAAHVSCLFVPAVKDTLGHGIEFSATTQWDPGILNLHGLAAITMWIKCRYTNADMQMLELPHGCDLMLPGNNPHKWSLTNYFLEDCDGCVQSDYVVGGWSAGMDTQLHRPWDPGGYVVPWYRVTGLRTSRNLRGRECHAPGSCPLALLGPYIWNGLLGLGLAQLLHQLVIKNERQQPRSAAN